MFVSFAFLPLVAWVRRSLVDADLAERDGPAELLQALDLVLEHLVSVERRLRHHVVLSYPLLPFERRNSFFTI